MKFPQLPRFSERARYELDQEQIREQLVLRAQQRRIRQLREARRRQQAEGLVLLLGIGIGLLAGRLWP